MIQTNIMESTGGIVGAMGIEVNIRCVEGWDLRAHAIPLAKFIFDIAIIFLIKILFNFFD